MVVVDDDDLDDSDGNINQDDNIADFRKPVIMMHFEMVTAMPIIYTMVMKIRQVNLALKLTVTLMVTLKMVILILPYSTKPSGTQSSVCIFLNGDGDSHHLFS